jgi:hypothetical protein
MILNLATSHYVTIHNGHQEPIQVLQAHLEVLGHVNLVLFRNQHNTLVQYVLEHPTQILGLVPVVAVAVDTLLGIHPVI